MRRALVTGATGMLGSYLVQRLVEDGYTVRALVRSPNGVEWLRDMGADIREGALADASALTSAATECDVVFHAAAAVGPQSDWETFRLGNVQGTRNVIDACAHAGARLVHVSSTAVYGDSRYEMAPVGEQCALPRLPAADAYGRSKQEAERLVLDAHDSGRIWASIVRPPVMYGERDRQFIPRIGAVMNRGIFPLCGGGVTTLPVVHANAVAEGAILAAHADIANGAVYNLTSDFPLTVAMLLCLARVGLARRILAPSLSLRSSRTFFRALELGLRIAGRGDLAAHSKGTLEMLTRDNPFSATRARDELHWAPTIRPETGVPDAFRWWKAHHGSA
ncbi:MAG: NAD-dependent epimerase/dehydratase family protein [Gemmatimonadota bacterium]|nr:NAD-dependent epimerase/dehydratase family protein [Gemmatimonadota bacterium]